MDIFITQNATGLDMICFSMSNGEVIITDDKLQKLFSINANNKKQYNLNEPIKQFVMKLIHPQKQDIEGDFLIVTDFNTLNVNVWSKEI